VPVKATQFVALVTLVAGCAKQMPVGVSLVSPEQSRFEGEIRPRYFELQHEKDGWIRVEVAEGMRQIDSALDKGVEVPVASADVPKGQYDKLRFAYVMVREPTPMAPQVPPAEGGISGERDDPAGGISGSREPTSAPAAEPVREEGEIVLDQKFCLDGTVGQQIVVEITRDESSLGAAPRFTLKAPGC
jgi:hypothetical protein